MGLSDVAPASALSKTSHFPLPTSSLPFPFPIHNFFFFFLRLFHYSFFGFPSYLFIYSVFCGFVWSLCDLFVFSLFFFFFFFSLCFYLRFLWSFCSFFLFFKNICMYVLGCLCGNVEKKDMNNKKGRGETKRKSN